MKHHIRWTFLPAIVLLTVATAMAQKPIDEIIVRINGDIILKSELENARTTLRNELAQGQHLQGAQLEQAVTEQSKFLLRDLIDQISKQEFRLFRNGLFKLSTLKMLSLGKFIA